MNQQHKLEKIILEKVKTTKQRVFYAEYFLAEFDLIDILNAFETFKTNSKAEIQYEIFCEHGHLSYCSVEKSDVYFCEECSPKRKIRTPSTKIRVVFPKT